LLSTGWFQKRIRA